MNTLIAIAIPTYNREQILIETIDQVFLLAPQPDEIIVVDQTPMHEPTVSKRLEEWQYQGKIKLVRQASPSLPAARNVALHTTRCDVVIFIDDDVLLPTRFVEAHKKNYSMSPDVSAVAGRVKQRLGWPQITRPLQWPRVLDYRFLNLDGDMRLERVANFIGCNHSVRVADVLSIGGYDESYRGSALREESDMALRLFLGGKRITFDPEAELYHLAAPSGGCRKRNLLDLSACGSVLRFSFKFRKVLGKHFYLEVWRALRIGVLNGTNAKNPHLLIASFALFTILAVKTALLPSRRLPER